MNLSPSDLARIGDEDMLERAHIPEAPWWAADAVDKKRARLDGISHLSAQIPYDAVTRMMW